MMKKYLFAPLFCIIFSANISAQSVNHSSFFFELSYGEGFYYPYAKPHKYDSSAMDKEDGRNIGNSIGNYVWNVGTNEEKALSLYAFENSPKPKVSGQNYNFLMEYVFKNGIGLGLSATSADFQGSNLTFSRDITQVGVILYDSLIGNQSLTQDDLKNIQILSPYYTYHQNDLLKMRIYSLQFSYHFLENSVFDPYLRIGVGYGNEALSHAKIFQSSVSMGTRFFFGQNLYALAEIAGNNYDGYSKVGNVIQQYNGKEGHAWTLQEILGRVGIGFKL
ncbi:hypothetical protein [Leptospira wolffii]|uniref:hypothetical protein n=1 Tax=Leptospira wolffii TaxID=409998 RepID=UPI0012EC89F4|nr:hypothetical protein [Leptospira wolffii]